MKTEKEMGLIQKNVRNMDILPIWVFCSCSLIFASSFHIENFKTTKALFVKSKTGGYPPKCYSPLHMNKSPLLMAHCIFIFFCLIHGFMCSCDKLHQQLPARCHFTLLTFFLMEKNEQSFISLCNTLLIRGAQCMVSLCVLKSIMKKQ